MFFHKKRRLRKQFDEKLMMEMDELKTKWQNKTAILERSFDPPEEVKITQKLSEAKYFFLFHEAKKRQIDMRR